MGALYSHGQRGKWEHSVSRGRAQHLAEPSPKAGALKKKGTRDHWAERSNINLE